MIALDTNLLVYAHRADMPQHRVAKVVLSELAEGPRPWAIAWPCIHEFFAVMTSGKFKTLSPPHVAWLAIERIASSPSLHLIGEGSNHLQWLARFVRRGDVSGGAIHDARIAAICLAHGVNELWTADRDFARFPELKTYNPLDS
ncbi:MAG: PIN domain-containing protein [Rudaea sp.]|uniref:type II toxin-antitoxin system VapC family toxin n=1 Tax=Rudaea sp. TaxID=2136325 RepID=UPI0039E501D2